MPSLRISFKSAPANPGGGRRRSACERAAGVITAYGQTGAGGGDPRTPYLLRTKPSGTHPYEAVANFWRTRKRTRHARARENPRYGYLGSYGVMRAHSHAAARPASPRAAEGRPFPRQYATGFRDGPESSFRANGYADPGRATMVAALSRNDPGSTGLPGHPRCIVRLPPIQGSARCSSERSYQTCVAQAREAGIRRSWPVPDTAIEAVLSERPFASSRRRPTSTTVCPAPDMTSSSYSRECGSSLCASQCSRVDRLWTESLSWHRWPTNPSGVCVPLSFSSVGLARQPVLSSANAPLGHGRRRPLRASDDGPDGRVRMDQLRAHDPELPGASQ
jgi:hypothetical protein